MAPANTKTNKVTDGIPVATIDTTITANLSKGKLASILSAVKKNISNEATTIHITSTYAREKADHIALDAAIFAANQEGDNVLLIDIDPVNNNYAVKNNLIPAISLDQFILDEITDQPPLLKLGIMPLTYAKLAAQDHSGNLLFNTRQLKELIAHFKASYNLIIIHSENAMKSGAASILAPLVDGTIIVVQADRTRFPVVKELVENITESGGKIAGTIMSGRRYYIPKFIYGFLFNPESRD